MLADLFKSRFYKALTHTVIAVCVVGFVQGSVAHADNHETEMETPPTLQELQYLPKLNNVVEGDPGLPIDIRNDAMREAALSYGARGGLASRTYAIRKELDNRTTYLGKVFDFRQLLMLAPSGLLIEPPIVSEQVNAMLINPSGQEAAVADRMYTINKNARIVSAARSWNMYLERDWGSVKPPPDILRPSNAMEREQWISWVTKGWELGIAQADAIYEQDLNEMTADFQGMVRYRMLLSQGMISPPFSLHVDRGVTGSGNVMRVGDRAIQITGKPQFIPEAEEWQPASR